MKRWFFVLVRAAQFILTMVLGMIILIAAQALGAAPFWGAGSAVTWISDPSIALWAFPGYIYIYAALFTIFMIAANASLSRHLEREPNKA